MMKKAMTTTIQMMPQTRSISAPEKRLRAAGRTWWPAAGAEEGCHNSKDDDEAKDVMHDQATLRSSISVPSPAPAVGLVG